jgi:hypothetical protein
VESTGHIYEQSTVGPDHMAYFFNGCLVQKYREQQKQQNEPSDNGAISAESTVGSSHFFLEGVAAIATTR